MFFSSPRPWLLLQQEEGKQGEEEEVEPLGKCK